MSELCDFPAVELRRLIGAKVISPVDLLESCLERIDRVNSRVNAIVALDRNMAGEGAREAEEAVMRAAPLAPLHGLPVGIKDLNDTAGLTTTYGSPLYADHVPRRDDRQVAAVRGAGGLVFAKTNTPEFGAGANTVNEVYGFTGNPFDPDKTASGSSGGSAAALATGMLPLATGSDLGGSLRTPAAYNGIVGFRPSAGMVPDPSRLLAWAPLSVEGPMARSVRDMALLLSVMVGHRHDDPLSGAWSQGRNDRIEPADLSPLRIALSEDLGFAPVDNEIRRVFRQRVAAFQHLFAAVEEKDPPLRGADRIFEVLRAVGFLAAHKERLQRYPDKVGPNVTANTRLGLSMSAADVAKAAAEHTALYRRFLKRYDLLICPTASLPPFAREFLYPEEINGQPLKTYISWIGVTYGITLTAHPVVVLPCGLDHTGMPFGIQLVGRRGEEWRLIAIAAALEDALADIEACRRPVPDLAALAS